MTLLIQKQPTNGYSTIADGDEETDNTSVPRTVRSWSGVVTIVAGLLLLVAGGAVWMKPDDGASYTTAAGGLVVATLADTPCLPASDTFSGISETDFGWFSAGQKYPFETCYQEEHAPSCALSRAQAPRGSRRMSFHVERCQYRSALTLRRLTATDRDPTTLPFQLPVGKRISPSSIS